MDGFYEEVLSDEPVVLLPGRKDHSALYDQVEESEGEVTSDTSQPVVSETEKTLRICSGNCHVGKVAAVAPGGPAFHVFLGCGGRRYCLCGSFLPGTQGLELAQESVEPDVKSKSLT
jgi:hypothetical protein